MSNYFRPRLPGATIFFTVCLAHRGGALLTDYIELLRDAYGRTCRERPVTTEAIVILPDHLHCVWTLPDGDTDYSTRWRLIQARFSRLLPFVARRACHIDRVDRGLWQRRFREHHIRDETALANAVSYCWNNPVKHRLTDDPFDWPHSSIHRDMRATLRDGRSRRDGTAHLGQSPPMPPPRALSPTVPLR